MHYVHDLVEDGRLVLIPALQGVCASSRQGETSWEFEPAHSAAHLFLRLWRVEKPRRKKTFVRIGSSNRSNRQ